MFRLFIIFLVFLFFSLIYAQPVKIAILEYNAPPFVMLKNGVYNGPILDIINELLYSVNIKSKIIPLPTKRILVYLKSGDIDGVIGLAYTRERDQYSHYLSTPIGTITTHLFVRNDEVFSFDKISDLNGMKICTLRGFSYGEEFDNAVKEKKIELIEVNSYKSMLAMLKNSHVNLVASPTIIFKKLIDDENLSEKIVRLEKPVRPLINLFVLISKASDIYEDKILLNSLNLSLKQMGDNNFIKSAYTKYGFNIQ